MVSEFPIAQLFPPWREKKIVANKKIQKLTDEQEQALVIHREYWLKVGLCTDLADRAATERVITEFYVRQGLTRPHFWWCDSPMLAQLVMNILSVANLRDNLGDNLGANLWANLEANLEANLRANLGANLGDNLWDNLRGNLGDNLWVNLWANLEDHQLRFFSTYFWGSLDSYWIAYYLYPQEYLSVKYKTDDAALLALWADLARSTFWWWPFEKIVVLSERPEKIERNAGGLLHCETAPACLFRDSWAVYYLNGVHVPRELVETPASEIDIRALLANENVEVRREGIRKVGMERVVSTLHPKVLDRQERPELNTEYELLTIDMNHGEPWHYLKMLNPAIKVWHVEAVPRECETVRQAINWRRFQNINKEWDPAQLS